MATGDVDGDGSELPFVTEAVTVTVDPDGVDVPPEVVHPGATATAKPTTNGAVSDASPLPQRSMLQPLISIRRQREHCRPHPSMATATDSCPSLSTGNCSGVEDARGHRAGQPAYRSEAQLGAHDIGQLVSHRVGLLLIGSLDHDPDERLGAGLAQQHST